MVTPAKVLFLLLLLVASARTDESTPARGTRVDFPFTPLATPHIHNAYRVTDKVLSGAQPEGEASFEALAALGVRTIISVDGAKPDVAAAKRHGLRYVHLPIGYDRVEPDEGKAIAKAIAELPGPIYVHCHHGKHRSAAAVAVACVQNGSLKPELAESVLRTFGTGENYVGLWQSAREAKPLGPATLRQLRVEFPETAKVPPLADAMVKVDGHFEHLKQLRKASWQPPQDHPDLSAAHEALQLHEHLIELGRGQSAEGKPPEYLELLTEGQKATGSLREALAAIPVRAADAREAMTRVGRSCTACHSDFRD